MVKKFFHDDNDTERKLFKEARLLNTLRHPNIVGLRGRCLDRYALLLEYIYFDLNPFGVNETVHCLQALLKYFDKKNCAQIDSKVFYHAANNIASGLQFLHENGTSHRDLKLANILFSNQHYCHLGNLAEIEEVSSRIPLTCKLTNFGESRSQGIYTNTLISTKTKNVNRGTPVYMPPEIFSKGHRLASASVEDLLMADIWAFGLVVFSLANPGLKHPFEVNMLTCTGTYTPLQCLEKFFAAKEKPMGQVKYASRQKNDWKKLVEVYEACTKFDRFKRPGIQRVLDLLNANSTSQSTSTTSEDAAMSEEFHLRVCHSTVIENVDGFVAAVAPIPVDISEVMVNDATNACVFFCVSNWPMSFYPKIICRVVLKSRI